MKIDPNKKYTSGGHPVEFLHRAPEGWPIPYPWRGVVNGFGMSWTDEGRYNKILTNADRDLIEVREPLRIKLAVDPENRPGYWIHADNEHKEMRPGWRIVEMIEVMPANNPPTA
jgi:hypothetical protein